MHVKVTPTEWGPNEPRVVRGSGMDDLTAGSWPEREDPSIYGVIFSEPGHRPMQMAPTVSREVATPIDSPTLQILGRGE